MKISTIFLLSCLYIVFGLNLMHGQGVIAPTAAPAPMFKTLNQIDAGQPIPSLDPDDSFLNPNHGSFTGYVIASPGRYYLTQNITLTQHRHGINIAASNVLLDLNGFTLTGPSSSTHSGISINGSTTNITIQNGQISSFKWGIDSQYSLANSFIGIRIYASTAQGIYADNNSHVIDCTIQNSSGTEALYAARSCIIERCILYSNTSTKAAYFGEGCIVKNSSFSNNTCTDVIYAGNTGTDESGVLISHCTAYNNTVLNSVITAGRGTIIDHCSIHKNIDNNSGSVLNAVEIKDNVQITNSTIVENTNFSGMATGNNCLIQNCTVSKNSASGINTGNYCKVINTTISGNGSTALRIFNYCSAIGCQIDTNDATGILASAFCQIKENNINDTAVSSTSKGIWNDGGTGGFYEKNIVSGFDEGICIPNGPGILIQGNYSVANATNYNIGTGNINGPVLSSVTSNTNPNANF